MNNSGGQTAAYSYDPYGQATATAVNGSGAKDIQTYGYAGGFDDPTSTLVHYGQRWYDPVTGRFTQPDPSDQEQNTYLYAGANPTNFVDPDGEFAAAVAVVGAVACNVGCLVAAAAATVVVGGLALASEHKKNARPSSEEQHQKGQARKKRDAAGEKKEKSGRYKGNPNKRGN